MSNQLQSLKESYDKFPYKSYPFPKSNPLHLRTLGTFFGMNPPEIKNAKVLEIGCAAGGNIIPLAVQYPDAHFLGIELSDVQASAGNDFIKKLDLTNISIKSCSITELDESLGQYDYIIAHGVYSWVTDDIREKILQICKENLSPSGIAYISYNTLPGWNTLSSIRDMALYHAKNFTLPEEQINQTKMLLNFISESIKGSETSYAKLMMESVEMLKNKPDYYIAHDFLEINNKAFYLSDFVDQVKSNNLQYLSDADISNMYLPNYSDAIAEKLGEINELVRMEQYLDFTINRTFRCSLICHDDVPINREIAPGNMDKFYLMQIVSSEKTEKDDDLSNSTIESGFYLGANQTNAVTSTDNVLKAMLYSFQEAAGFISFDSLLALVASKLPKQESENLKVKLETGLLNLFMRGTLKISTDPITVNTSSTALPKAWSYAANQCKFSDESIVTNLYHQTVSLSLFETYMIRYIDGTRSKEEVIEKMLEHVKQGDLEANYGGKKLTDDEKIKNILSLAYLDAIDKFRDNGLLL